MKLLISIFIQLISVPIIYHVSYFFLSFFKEQTIPLNSSDGMDFYGYTLIFATLFLILTTVVINILNLFIENSPLILLHIAILVLFTKSTWGDLMYRPYDYGLILICIWLSIPLRLIVNKIIYKP